MIGLRIWYPNARHAKILHYLRIEMLDACMHKNLTEASARMQNRFLDACVKLASDHQAPTTFMCCFGISRRNFEGKQGRRPLVAGPLRHLEWHRNSLSLALVIAT